MPLMTDARGTAVGAIVGAFAAFVLLLTAPGTAAVRTHGLRGRRNRRPQPGAVKRLEGLRPPQLSALLLSSMKPPAASAQASAISPIPESVGMGSSTNTSVVPAGEVQPSTVTVTL